MRIVSYLQVAGLAVALSLPLAARADDDRDIEGVIESIDARNRSFVVDGKTYRADDRTDYDDDLKQFSDLRVGQRVEVDYVIRDGDRLATEIELDD